MIADLKPYLAMKDSGVPWLGEVPEHWEVLALKRLGWFKGGAGFPVEQQGQRDLELPFFKVSDMNLPGNGKVMSIWNNAVSSSTAASLGATIFPAGTIVFPKVGGAMLTNKRRVVERPCCIDNNLMGCVIRRGNPSFLLLVMQYLDFTTIAKPGPVPAISEGEVREIRIVSPPLPEQAAIVRFLNYANRRIEHYIRAKKKLIALLDEQKQAIIQRAVTRGLDPNVRLKASGVPWLGDIPEHWEIRSAKHLFREVDHRSATGTEVLLSLRMYQGLVPHNEVSRIPITAQALVGFKKVKCGQIVMNRMRAAIGMFGLVHQSGLVSPDYAVFEPVADVDPLYFLRVFKTPAAGTVFRIESKGLGTGSSGFMRLYTDRFGMIKLPVPPREEQTRIVLGIARNIQEIERSEERIKRQIGVLVEFRSRLIVDVVTGQLDVRKAAAKLPEEPRGEDIEPVEDSADDEAEESEFEEVAGSGTIG